MLARLEPANISHHPSSTNVKPPAISPSDSSNTFLMVACLLFAEIRWLDGVIRVQRYQDLHGRVCAVVADDERFGRKQN